MKGVRRIVDGKQQIVLLVEKPCLECSKIFQPVRSDSRFCSRSCMRKDHYKRIRRVKNLEYKDKTRHGGKRAEMVKKDGLKCVQCGKIGNSFQIVAHHITLNPQDHSQQELLCRACHCRLHHSNEKKPLTKEQIETAISTTKNLNEACKVLGVNSSSLYWKRKRLNLV